MTREKQLLEAIVDSSPNFAHEEYLRFYAFAEGSVTLEELPFNTQMRLYYMKWDQKQVERYVDGLDVILRERGIIEEDCGMLFHLYEILTIDVIWSDRVLSFDGFETTYTWDPVWDVTLRDWINDKMIKAGTVAEARRRFWEDPLPPFLEEKQLEE